MDVNEAEVILLIGIITDIEHGEKEKALKKFGKYLEIFGGSEYAKEVGNAITLKERK